jgi:ADP-ribose pyrophosphatase YjhB (NUDIX family)
MSDDDPDLARRLARLADRLRDLSALGLRFSKNIYDREHFRAVQDVSLELLALATGQSPLALEPIREAVLSRPTPFVGADAAVIDGDGRILLIRRADNGLWAMPGGALEVGETPAAGAEREAFEETGVRCRAEALIGLFDSRLCGSTIPLHLYHVTFLCEPLDASAIGAGSHRQEVLGVAWFVESALPANIDPGHVSRIPEAYRVWRGDRQAFFDPGG